MQVIERLIRRTSARVISIGFVVVGVALIIIWPVYLHYKPMLDENALLNRAEGIELTVKEYKSDMVLNYSLKGAYEDGYLSRWKGKLKTTIQLYLAKGDEDYFTKGKLLYEGEARKSGNNWTSRPGTHFGYTGDWVHNYYNYIWIPASTITKLSLKLFQECHEPYFSWEETWCVEKCRIKPPIVIEVAVEKPNGRLLRKSKFLDKIYILRDIGSTKHYNFIGATPLK